MRIAQAAALCGLSPRQIRYYQAIGVLTEGDRAQGRHREFTDRDVRRLRVLKTLLAADAPPALAVRVLDGALTVPERTEVERLLDLQLAADRETRISIAATDREELVAGQPDISLMFDIFVLRTRMGAVLTEALTDVGLTATEYALLSLLRESPSRTAAELARLLGIAPTTLGRQLAELVRRGWMSRSADRRDRRRIVVSLTRKGDLRFQAALPHAARVAADLDRGLRQRSTDPDHARALLQTLSAALDTLAPDRSS